MKWEIWRLKPHTGDKDTLVAEYYNKGHAVMRLRGLRKASWRGKSEIDYGLYKVYAGTKSYQQGILNVEKENI